MSQVLVVSRKEEEQGIKYHGPADDSVALPGVAQGEKRPPCRGTAFEVPGQGFAIQAWEVGMQAQYLRTYVARANENERRYVAAPDRPLAMTGNYGSRGPRMGSARLD